ncbi:MAG: TRAP transporter large permease, partial [Planctomycetes bacterium]|nr:TRAP transporter large permease [Planctomycetota bacterium]
ADTSALGSVLIPAMEKRGYPPEFAAGITVASSTMGMIIPPSIPLIMYSMISGASIGSLFIAGLIPGVLVGVLQLVVCFVISRRNGYHPKAEPFNRAHFTRTMLLGLPAAIMPLIILTVSFGIATASESAAVAVAYSLLLGIFLYRSLTWSAVLRALRRTLISSSSIVIIIGFSTIFTWQMTMQQVPQTIATFFLSLELSKYTILAIFVILILILGTFIDVSPAILMLTPIMLPIMRQIGMSDLQFGAMFITGLAIGLVTPPVGMCLNVCNKINGMPIMQIARGAMPFVLCNVAVLACVAFIPALSTWLPRIISY